MLRKYALVLWTTGLLAYSPYPFAFAQTAPPLQGVVENQGSAQVNWTEGVIKVTGSGAPPDRGSASQRRLLAERAAIADAYRQLAEIIHGVRVDSETVVQDFVTESDAIKLQVSALIKGAQKLDRRFLSDGSIEVDMVVKLYSQTGLSGIIQPQKQRVPPPPLEVPPLKPEEAYTGVIVDCRGLGIQPAMSPALMSQKGGEVYVGQLPVDPDFVVNNGIVAYVESLAEARQHPRAGQNPLIIRGVSAGGRLKADAVIEEKDARLLLGLEKEYAILKDAKVVFVL